MKRSSNIPRDYRIQIIRCKNVLKSKFFLNSIFWNTVSHILSVYESMSEEYDWEEWEENVYKFGRSKNFELASFPRVDKFKLTEEFHEFFNFKILEIFVELQ